MKKILIVGGGFGGVRVALDLERRLRKRRDVEITLLDHHSRHTFTPSLYELVTAYPPEVVQRELEEMVAIPYAEIFYGKRVNFVQAHVINLNLNSREVSTKEGIYKSDYLVLALGGSVNTFGIPGLEVHSLLLRSLEDAFRIRKKVCEIVTKKGNINIVIGGAGPAGIELACELIRFTRQLSRACGKNPAKNRVRVLEALSTILPGQSRRVIEIVQRRLKECDVVIQTDCAINDVREGQLSCKMDNQTKDEPFDLLVWTGGVKAHPLVASLEGAKKDKKGRLQVAPTLEVEGQAGIFALGDCASVIPRGDDKPWPELAYLAIDEGKIVADNVAAHLGGKSIDSKIQARQNFPFILPLGGAHALVVTRSFVFNGALGWFVHKFVSLHYLLSILTFGRALTRWGQSFHL